MFQSTLDILKRAYLNYLRKIVIHLHYSLYVGSFRKGLFLFHFLSFIFMVCLIDVWWRVMGQTLRIPLRDLTRPHRRLWGLKGLL